MGGCPMGQYGWGEVQEQELIDAVHAALDCGVNFFDTADTYGLGTSELTLGKALGTRRSQAVIATKFGVRAGSGETTYDNSPEWIRTACEESLKRLGTDYIDLYQVHYRDGKTDIHTVVDTLQQLQQQGKIRYFGLSNIKDADLEELGEYFTEIKIFCNDKPGILVDVSRVFAERDINILGLHSRLNKQGVATIEVSFNTKGRQQINSLIERLRQIENIIEIQRTTG